MVGRRGGGGGGCSERGEGGDQWGGGSSEQLKRIGLGRVHAFVCMLLSLWVLRVGRLEITGGGLGEAQ